MTELEELDERFAEAVLRLRRRYGSMNTERLRAARGTPDEQLYEDHWQTVRRRFGATVEDAIRFWREEGLRYVQVGDVLPYDYLPAPGYGWTILMMPPRTMSQLFCPAQWNADIPPVVSRPPSPWRFDKVIWRRMMPGGPVDDYWWRRVS